MFNPEKVKPFKPILEEEEKDNSRKLEICKSDILDYIQSLREKGNILGSGQTADVCYSKTNSRLCYKIIRSKEYYYNNVEEEARFLSAAREINNTEVIIPEPEYSISNEDESLNALAMERLDAFSIEDLLNEKEALPANFDFRGFFKKLENFVVKLNQAKIFHRDIHPGNIMIERKTDKPCLIDFGAAKKNFFSSEDPYRYLDAKGELIIFTNDLIGIQQVKNKVRDYILERRAQEKTA